MSNDPIANTFQIAPLEIKKTGRIVFPDPNDDYELARQNMKDLIEKGMSHFREYGEICQSVQEPRAYEVLSTMFNSLMDANQKLLDLKKTEMEAAALEAKVNGIPDDPRNVTNNLFVGSTAEFQDLIMSKIAERNNATTIEENPTTEDSDR